MDYRNTWGYPLSLALLICARYLMRGAAGPASVEQIAQAARRWFAHARPAYSPGALTRELANSRHLQRHARPPAKVRSAGFGRFSPRHCARVSHAVNTCGRIGKWRWGKARTVAGYEDVLASTLEECERLGRLVDQLLSLLVPRINCHPAIEELNVEEELSAVREFLEAAAHEAGVALNVEASPILTLAANQDLFRCAVGNLVSNALAHTPKDGRVIIRARADNG